MAMPTALSVLFVSVIICCCSSVIGRIFNARADIYQKQYKIKNTLVIFCACFILLTLILAD